MLTRPQKLLLSILSGLLLSLPWYKEFSSLLLFVAFVPLLILEDSYKSKPGRTSQSIIWYVLLSFFLWNSITYWWIYKPTLAGATGVILINTCLFTIVFWLFHLSKSITGGKFGYLYLLVYWIGCEFFYLNAEISYPWLILGNGFANSVKLIQWYEYTGALGGSLWVLTTNILIADIVLQYAKFRKLKLLQKKTGIISILLIVPIAFSLVRYYSYKEKYNPYNIAIIQPNIDPYFDKFGKKSQKEQLQTLLNEAEKTGNNETDYFLGPETALQGRNLLSAITTNRGVEAIRHFLIKYPKAKFIIGAETTKEYQPGESPSTTARKLSNANVWTDSYNSALQIDTTSIVQIYHKSKLVVGVEKMPYSKYLRFLENYAIKLGGTYGSLGTQSVRGTFESHNGNSCIAPVICYESIYGEFIHGYIQKGANLIFILTNEGWFGDTPGPLQHLNYARLRAIETRRSIARSANTGISAFINQRGDVIKTLGWWQRGSIEGALNANDEQTFYVKYGDYIGRFTCYFALLGLGFTVYVKIKSRSI